MTCRILCILLLSLPLMAIDTEWTQYGGPNRNFTSSEKIPLEEWPESGPKELWRHTVGAGFASPIAVDGKIYCFSTIDEKDTLTCINADDGRILWAQPGESAFIGSLPGTRATPAVDDQHIYTFGGRGDLICRNLVDGRERWTLDIIDETSATLLHWGCASSPVILGNLLFLQVGDNGPMVVAVDTNKRKIAWQSEETGPCSYGSVTPITIDGKTQLLVQTGKGLFALDPATGKTLWKIPPKAGGSSDVSPVYSNGHLLLAAGYGEGAAMFTIDGKPDSEPECLWEKKEPSTYYVSPLLEGEFLYIAHKDSLYCLHWPDGEEVWQTDLGLGGSGGQYVRVGDKMIMITFEGELLLVKVTPKEGTLISKIKMLDKQSL
ncbi:MAG: PQQ-like beta-propeller repeat protein, partial [Phycisphaerales bacterium]|nr:PQQ-like beta-propeller repeat protein [Phycisphaerales bacterium]